MKNFVFILLLIPFGLMAQHKNFEGTIWFSLQYSSSSPRYDPGPFHSFFGDSMICYISKGDIRQDYLNSTGIEYVIYDSKTDHYNYKLRGRDTLFYVDGRREEKTGRIKEFKEKYLVGGHECRKFRVKQGNVTTLYYFATDYYLDPGYYKNYKIGAYNLLMEKAHSIYVKQEAKQGRLSSVMTADSISEAPLDPRIFELPSLPQVGK
jgi:hypothetical protein